jgi:arginyl-tRNA--protein-N-Asp/Glu arginylyltransferase
MIRQMYMNPQSSLELTVSENGRVLAFATFDATDDSLSAVYSVFEPEMPERSLGTLNVLLAIQKVKDLGLQYLNLGLYLEKHPKMSYKANFGPAEVYEGFSWKTKH